MKIKRTAGTILRFLGGSWMFLWFFIYFINGLNGTSINFKSLGFLLLIGFVIVVIGEALRTKSEK
ncbi:hypothetical protein ABS362_12910 [Pontibacter populi]|uniref:Uncharacterized protein n=1 Tax=Pontibacter populi TaxID=890055 RepID=A0ABV1RVM5_9BACT